MSETDESRLQYNPIPYTEFEFREWLDSLPDGAIVPSGTRWEDL